MTSPFVPETVMFRFVRSVLAADATVLAQLGGVTRIAAKVASPSVGKNRHLVSNYAGPEGGLRAEPLGRALSQITLRWDVTAWEPDWSQQALEPLMLAVQTVLIGPDARGKKHVYSDGGESYRAEVQYLGPIQIPLDLQPAGVWSPLSERYQIALRKVA